jgi:hypothetical protein
MSKCQFPITSDPDTGEILQVLKRKFEKLEEKTSGKCLVNELKVDDLLELLYKKINHVKENCEGPSGKKPCSCSSNEQKEPPVKECQCAQQGPAKECQCQKCQEQSPHEHPPAQPVKECPKCPDPPPVSPMDCPKCPVYPACPPCLNPGPVEEPVKEIPWIGDLPDPIKPPVNETPKPPDVVLNTVGQMTPEGNDCIGGKWMRKTSEAVLNIQGNNHGVTKSESHAPSGISWITEEDWKAAEWDGVPRDMCKMSRQEICSWAFPKWHTMRGLKQMYDKQPAFADPKNPTVSEIEAWNVRVVNHARDLFGIKVRVKNDRCLHLLAHWAEERGSTRKWDIPKYPGGCPEPHTHCGVGFMPDCEDQKPYLKEGEACCPGLNGGFPAEGILGVRVDHPWSIRMATIIGRYICQQAGTGGHMGAIFKSTSMGLSWFCIPADIDREMKEVGFPWWSGLRIQYGPEVEDPNYCART